MYAEAALKGQFVYRHTSTEEEDDTILTPLTLRSRNALFKHPEPLFTICLILPLPCPGRLFAVSGHNRQAIVPLQAPLTKDFHDHLLVA